MQPRSIVFRLVLAFLPAPLWSSAYAQDEDFDALKERFGQLFDQGKYAEAERVARRMRAVEDFYSNTFLGISLMQQGKFKEAEPLFQKYLRLCRARHGESDVTAEALLNLGGMYVAEYRLKEALPLLEEANASSLKVNGANHRTTLSCQASLATFYKEMGDLKQAAQLYRKIIDAQHKLGIDVPAERLAPIANLISVYMSMGRYDLAESMGRYGIEVGKSIRADPDHHDAITVIYLLGVTFAVQGRFEEALYLEQWALEGGLRSNYPKLGLLYGGLGDCYANLGQFDKGIALLKRGIEVTQAQQGAGHRYFCSLYYALGWQYLLAGHVAEAETALRQSLKIAVEHFGESHDLALMSRLPLADCLLQQGKDVEAAALLDQFSSDRAMKRLSHRFHSVALTLKAELAWKHGDRSTAMELLQRALELADESRAVMGGADVERAVAFSYYHDQFELLVGWQTELQDAAGAFTTLERCRARAFLDALSAPDVDPLVQRSPQERDQIKQREDGLRNRVSLLESELAGLAVTDAEDAGKARAEKEQALAVAKAELYDHYRELRSSSPAYRQLISTGPKLPALAEAQQQLVPEKSLLLSYFIGDEGSYVLVVRPQDARLIRLTLDAESAPILGGQPGPLTMSLLRETLMNKDGTGALQRIVDHGSLDDALVKLEALWKVIIPADVRQGILSGELKRLTILPDGPLALLPLEVLVVERSPQPTYLLDVAPPIAYGPSAAVLMNLAARPASALAPEGVLTLGDPAYGPPDALQTPGSRQAAFRGTLTRLPHSGLESNWVAQVFQAAGAKPAQLLGREATESKLRENIAGRQIVHLACHGTSDNAFGNFFGALAVAPGKVPQGKSAPDPKDDGSLSLAEIYELNLKGCELSILSACLTNYGPQQHGEGVWGLSRGFLLAGSRRVIASNWLVDDEAGANLISMTCSDIARSQKLNQAPDYAAALLGAKRSVRKQAKWQHPYYWAPFVLVGPN